MAINVTSQKMGAADTAITVVLNGDAPHGNQQSKSNGNVQNKHQLSIDPGCNSVGTVTITAKAVGGVDGETVFEEDGTTPLVIDLSDANKAFTRNMVGVLESVTFTGSGMTDGVEWQATVNSGD